MSLLEDSGKKTGHELNTFLYDGLYLPCPSPFRLTGDNPSEQIKSIKSAQMYDDDVIVCAYPKCGSHWLSQVLSMLRNGSIQYSELMLASRMIDFACKTGLEALPPPRILHTHLPLRMLPKQILEKKIKCVQILRNPKDVCVSFFNHAKRVAPPDTYQGDFHEFTDVFFTEQKLAKECPSSMGSTDEQRYCSIVNVSVPYGSWKADVSRFQDLPFLCLFYEDMTVHPLKCVKELRAFLGLNITDAFCEAVVEACSFDKLRMKERTGMKDGAVVSIWKEGSGGTFYRKGEVGDWKKWFTVSESENFDITWNEKMNGSGIEFSYSVP